jgi:hypothetical protein
VVRQHYQQELFWARWWGAEAIVHATNEHAPLVKRHQWAVLVYEAKI